MDTYLLSKGAFKICTLINMPEAKWTLKKKFPKVFFLPHMKQDEFLLFKKICERNHTFLEYGSGGSTIHLLKKGKRVFSVESNPEFFQYMSSINLVKANMNENLIYRFIDLGPTNQWGKPTSQETAPLWENYYAKIWQEIDPAKDKVDAIFIDGRFRVCCCLYSISKIIDFGWNDTTFVIHDFWRRKKYHVLLDFLKVEKSASDLAVFRLKKAVNIREIREKIEDYALSTA